MHFRVCLQLSSGLTVQVAGRTGRLYGGEAGRIVGRDATNGRSEPNFTCDFGLDCPKYDPKSASRPARAGGRADLDSLKRPEAGVLQEFVFAVG